MPRSKAIHFRASLMGIVKPYPPRGPFPVEDEWRMGPAAVLLMRLLDKGKNSEFVQYETIRKVRSHFSNFIHTILGGISDMFISSDNVVNGISRSATNTPWFKRFMKGWHSRMGDVWCPDRPLTMREGLLSQSLLEEDWKTFEKDAIGRLRTAITGMMITGLGGGMRGEEMVRVDVGLIRKHWAEALAHPEEGHILLAMSGRFKRQVGENMYVQLLALKSASGLQYRLWMHRTLQEYERIGVVDGPVFRVAVKRQGQGAVGQTGLKRARVGNLNLVFIPLLLRVQEKYPETIGPDGQVEEEYSASRSFKRGATSQARIMEIPADVIEANNRWRKEERARGSTPHMALLGRYADGKAMIPVLVRFSKML
jgi:hypothetical protein